MRSFKETWWQKLMPELLLVIYLFLFLMVKQPYLSHDRVIISDGKAYYGYLTAIFIYQDLTYGFIDDYEKKYYSSDPGQWKEFRTHTGFGIVNKAFPGLAVLFLPFFLIAHFLTLALGFPADGYSVIYQYTMGLCALFYFWLGLKYMRLLLRSFGFGNKLTAAILFIIAMGTNIIYYTLKEGTMSHVYSFALIAAFLYLIRKLSAGFRRKHLLVAALLFGLVITIRPTNVLVLLLVPFVAGSWEQTKKLLLSTFKPGKNLIAALSALLVFPALTMILWFIQSGRPIVYSYGDEGFDFLNPHFFQILFSFDKGWFVYTPIALLSMAGLIRLFRHNRFQFYWMTAFLVIFVYAASSWWVWNYTSNFGQRIFIDLYAVVALLLGFSWKLTSGRKIIRQLAQVVVLLLILLNGLQFYQHYNYVFPPGKITAEKYADAFARFVPAARVDIPDTLIIQRKTFYNDFENDYGWLNRGSVTDTLAYQGRFSSMPGLINPYSIGLLTDVNPLISSLYPWVKISARIYSDSGNADAVLVLQFENQNGHYFYKPWYMNSYNKKNRWVYVEFATSLPPLQSPDDQVRVFFYNPNPYELFLVDNLKIEILSLRQQFTLY